MVKHVLLYNLSGEKRKKVRVCLTRLGLRGRDVTEEEFGLPIGRLAGLEGFAEAEAAEYEPFRNEMLVLNGLTDGQLNALLTSLRTARAAVALKAVITEHNASWTGSQLCRELLQEHEALTGKTAKQAAQDTVHES